MPPAIAVGSWAMPDLSSNNREILLELARNAIRTHLETGNDFSFRTDVPELNWNRGCFVTLRKHSELRGCVGTFDIKEPLFQNVTRMAVASAVRDTRFPPVSKSELPLVTIEISVLSPLEKVSVLDEIEIGKHGVLVQLGNRSGTFLPEVAVDQKWSREEFVVRCARAKAGLRTKDCAQAEIYRYEVEKFSEPELPHKPKN